MRDEEKVAGGAVSPSACRGRLPVREHLRPRAGQRIVAVGDVAPRTLRLFPDVVAELNSRLVHVRQPGGWIVADLPLEEALALRTEGEA